ncbi:type I polyketide synthase [Dactylosporangium cerinum]
MARALALTRATFEHRAVVLARDLTGHLEGLAAVASGTVEDVPTGRVPAGTGVVLVFPGQGGQWAGMAVELLERSPVFAARLRECDAVLDFPLIEILTGADQEWLERVDVVQPVLWAVMVSLAAVWESFGVPIAGVVGHSQGEIAAAVVAGALSLADGALVVSARSRLLRDLAGTGGMLVVGAPVDELGELPDGVGVAAVNGPSLIVVSGDIAGLDAVAADCAQRGVWAKRVPVDYASHSVHVEAIREPLLAALEGLTAQPGRLPFYSTVTGERIDGTVLDARYWFDNLRRPVRFDDVIASLVADGHTAFVEVSPHPVLTGAVQDRVGQVDGLVTGTLRRDEGDWEQILRAAAQVWIGGVDVDWSAIVGGADGEPHPLPTYAFQREHFWLSGPASPPGATDGVETAFWDEVEQGDRDGLARLLHLDTDDDVASLETLLPALSNWHRRRKSRSTVDSWRYQVTWKPIPEPAAAPLPGTWLVATQDDTGADVTDALRAAGATVHHLRLEAGDTDRAAVADRLFEALADAGEPTGVLWLPAGGDTATAATVLLLQALDTADLGVPVWCVTRGAVSVGRVEPLHSMVQAQVWGLGRVAALEFPRWWGGLIDLPETVDGRVGERLVSVLAQRVEDQVVVRASGVFGRRLVRASGVAAPAVWVPRGSVLVTGGTGALGAHVARWLAGRGVPRLVLTSRRGLDAPGAAELVDELTALGVVVSVVACDVADRDALAAVLTAIPAEHPLTAVIHAAGVGTAAPLTELDPDALSDTVRGKVAGAVNLDELTADLPLERFVVFSSGAGIWGGGGQAAYAAGNAFLDALAQDRRARGLPATAVAWGAWAGDGMASLGEGTAFLRRRGLAPMDPALAVEALAEAVDAGVGSVVVADIDWERFAPAFVSSRPSPLLADLPEVARLLAAAGGTGDGRPVTPLAERLAGATEAERAALVLDAVRTAVAAVLKYAGAEAVEASRPFKDLGFDSTTAVELRNRLNTVTGLRLPATLAFDHPTPAVLTRHLLGALAPEPHRERAAVAKAANAGDEPIAIVGIGCRYPGGIRSAEDLWELVAAGGDAVGEFPTDRGWDLADNGGFARAGGFLYDVGDFDAAFFEISPREAVTMDPQQRLLLETSWEAFERAGIDPHTLRGSDTGVYVGSTVQDYAVVLMNAEDSAEGHMLTGVNASILSGRLAYTFGLEGSAVSVDTACSSSLVALHLAAQAVRQGDCALALAAGVTVMSTPGPFVEFSRLDGLAPDGRCKPFAEAADGTGWGEGAGVVLLERLSDARRNGHPVLAVIRGGALNQDGASNGLTAPNGPSQQRVIRQALANAGLTTADVDVVEAHGTATTLGDPIEAQALLATYGQDRPDDRPLWLGSVKSNIGHTQAAAGMAGVIKMVMALRHGIVPQTLHVDAPTSHVDWSAGAVRLAAEPLSWPDTGRARRAGISAFGASGTNAHVIIEQPAPATAPEKAPETAPQHAPETLAWLLSGRGEAALQTQALRLQAHLAAHPELTAPDISAALAATRSRFEHRAVITGRDRADLVRGLEALAARDPSPAVVTGAGRGDSDAVFVFPGQGSQWEGMAIDLYEREPVFRERFDACAGALTPHVDWAPLDVLLGVPGAPSLERVDVVQPMLFAVMVSLAAVWRSRGVYPAAVIGHSQGEIAAACVAGALTLEDAAKVVALRSRALVDLGGAGGMVSLALTVGQVGERLAAWPGRLSVAAVNGPSSVVVSGDAAALDELLAGCETDGVRARRIPVDYASHSHHVEPLRETLTRLLGDVDARRSTVPFYSAVTGDRLDTEALDAGYWFRNLRETVRFDDAVRAVPGSRQVFIEVSPHPVLTMALTEIFTEAVGPGSSPATAIGTLRRGEGGPDRLLTSLAEAYVRGVPVDWTVSTGRLERPVDLPTYAFQRQRYWPRIRVAQAPENPAVGGAPAFESQFWAAVERHDRDELTRSLRLDPAGAGESLDALLPALSSWHRRGREVSAADRLRYTVTWKITSETSVPVLNGRWIALVPAGHVADEHVVACVKGLCTYGAEVTTVVVDPATADRDGLGADLRDAVEQGTAPTGILSLLGFDTGPHPEHPELPVGLTATLDLLHAVNDVRAGAPLWCVTQGAVAATGQETVADPVQAQIWGLGRVAALEQPWHWGGLVDLPPVVDNRVVSRLAGALGRADGEDQLAVRTAGVYVRRLARAAVGDAAALRTWEPAGTVLVTGGTGALGGHVARWLAGRGAEHVVLTSRSGRAAPGVLDLEAELEAAGTRVSVASCDLAVREQVAALLAGLEEAGTPVRSVFHTAGVGSLVDLTDTDLTELAHIATGKIAGARHLDELLDPASLDAVVYFSSIAGMWGVGQHGGYAAANAYLDALAQRRRAEGAPVLSIAWGPWGGGGMVHATAETPMHRRGVPLLDPAQALAAMQHSLDHDDTYVALVDVDWERFVPAFTGLRPSPLIGDVPEAGSCSPPRPSRPTPTRAPPPRRCSSCGSGSGRCPAPTGTASCSTWCAGTPRSSSGMPAATRSSRRSRSASSGSTPSPRWSCATGSRTRPA